MPFVIVGRIDIDQDPRVIAGYIDDPAAAAGNEGSKPARFVEGKNVRDQGR